LMYKLRGYVKQDVYDIDVGYEFDRRLLVEGQTTLGSTLLDGETVLATGGIHMMWEGVGEAWTLVSPKLRGNGLVFARYTKRMFDDIIEANNLRRVQATIHVDDEVSLRFASWLGFKDEGIMSKYGVNGEDYFRVARVA